MRQPVLIIGATGFVGAAIANHLAAEGHPVSGLGRSDEAAAKLRARNISPVAGDLQRHTAPVLTAAQSADTVIYAAQVAFEREPEVLLSLADALAGTGETLVFLSAPVCSCSEHTGAEAPTASPRMTPSSPSRSRCCAWRLKASSAPPPQRVSG